MPSDSFITIRWDRKTGEITLEDGSGVVRKAKGALVVAHDLSAKEGVCIAQGDPTEIAMGLGEGLSRLVPVDPYYWTLYRAILYQFTVRTKEQKDGADLLEKWEKEDAGKRFH